jgi:hypothetical protein
MGSHHDNPQIHPWFRQIWSWYRFTVLWHLPFHSSAELTSTAIPHAWVL